MSIVAQSTQPVPGIPAISSCSAASGPSVRDRQTRLLWLAPHSLSVSASLLNAVISQQNDHETELPGSHVHGTGTGLGPRPPPDSQRGSPSGSCHTCLCDPPSGQLGTCTHSKPWVVAAARSSPGHAKATLLAQEKSGLLRRQASMGQSRLWD